MFFLFLSIDLVVISVSIRATPCFLDIFFFDFRKIVWNIFVLYGTYGTISDCQYHIDKVINRILFSPILHFIFTFIHREIAGLFSLYCMTWYRMDPSPKKSMALSIDIITNHFISPLKYVNYLIIVVHLKVSHSKFEERDIY